jgi:hypothetical protein
VLPYTAFLRVYEPLEAFPEPERSWWEAYAGHAGHLEHAGPSPLEQAAHSAAAGQADARRPPVRGGQNAHVRRFAGRAYICPQRRQLRSWEDFSAFYGLPRTPPAPLDTHVRVSAWHVPFPWFVPFVREERRLEFGGPPPSPRSSRRPKRSLTYLTTMARARERLTRATVAGERARTDVSPFGDARSLQEELSVFHPKSLVELDYGGLVHLMDDDALAADDSVGECAVALVALERGELELAVAMQLRLRARWRAIRALQSAN